VEVAAPGEIVHHVIDPTRLEAGQSHMGHEFSRIRRQTDALANALDFSLQGEHFRGG